MNTFRCLRTGLSILRSSTTTTTTFQPSRSLSCLSRLPTRPLAPTSSPQSATALDTPTSSFQAPTSPSGSREQVRGAKRDTFNPSHIVRKRRHGFLARLRTRNGRAVLKRRKLKGRNTLSH